ncbi:MAG: hypothetical protein ACKO5K_00495 [Armatimonadota bacterium]
MRLISGGLAALSLAIVLGRPVAAQDASPSKYFAHVGFNRALSSSVRNALSDTGVAAGAGLVLRNGLVRTEGSQSSVEIDFLRNSANGDRLDTAGLAYTVRIPTGAGNDDTKPYYGLGLGWYRSEAKATSQGTSGSPTTITEKATNFGAKFLVGANVGGKAFAEASYILSGKVAGEKTDSVNFTVGLRF